MKKRPLALVAGLSAVVVAAAAYYTPALTAGTGAARTTNGGTIIRALPPATNIGWYMPIQNGANASEYNTQLISQMYPWLIYIDDKYGIDYKDSFASNITYNKAGTEYTIDLKHNWKWSDGQPVTAKDVVWTFKMIEATDNPKAPAPWPNYNAGSGGVPDNVKSVVATNNYQVKITLKQPANQQWFIYNGIGQIETMPEHAWDKYPSNLNKELTYLGKNATNWKFFNVVDGPFKLQNAVTNQAWTLVPNPTFAGHKSTLSKLVFQYEASADAEFAALKTGALDLGYLDLAQYGSKGALTSMGYSVNAAYNFGYFFIELNQLKGSPLYSAFSDVKVRQALEMGIDQNTIDSSIYKGFAPAQYGPIPATPKTVFFDPRLNQPLYAFNVNKATKLLESDGWKMQNGVMTKDGQQLKFDVMVASGSESTTQQVELIQQDWKQMGVDITLKPMPFDNEIGIMSDSKNPQKWAAAAGTGITYGGSYPSGEQLFEPGGLDSFGYDNKHLDALIAKTTKPAANQAQIMKDFFAYEDYTANQVPVLWVNVPATLRVVGSKVQGATEQYMNPTVGVNPLLNYLSVKN